MTFPTRGNTVTTTTQLRRALARVLFAALCLFAAPGAHALEVIFDGVSSGEFTDSYTFSFGASNIDGPGQYKETYDFWVSGAATAQASVQLTLDPCTRGCGNPAVDYDIYADGQKLQANADGTYTLALGDHTYQIHITGMGSGNNVDYSGQITFSAISATPEPGEWLLMLVGVAAAGYQARRRKAEAGASAPVFARIAPVFGRPHVRARSV